MIQPSPVEWVMPYWFGVPPAASEANHILLALGILLVFSLILFLPWQCLTSTATITFVTCLVDQAYTLASDSAGLVLEYLKRASKA